MPHPVLPPLAISATNRLLAYCTNVHAGAGLDTTLENLRQYALDVKNRYSPQQPMGIGLWLSAQAAGQLQAQARVPEFAGWLAEAGLVPLTMNGFPHGDFHQDVVKHRVYLPTWWEPARLEYTKQLANIQDAMLPAGMEGSISTLPIAWGSPALTQDQLRGSADAFRALARHLEHLEQQSGRLIHVNIEPEPGCALQTSRDMVRFFTEYLFTSSAEADQIRRYIRVCHDVCHAAVMFEPQREVLMRYRDAGIGVGKVQVSSAVRVDLQPLSKPEKQAALAQLAGFNEHRYLHQTCVGREGEGYTFHEDLGLALAAAERGEGLDCEWRVHFHVPVYLAQFGHLATSQGDIQPVISAGRELVDTTHFEVETYAWGVLPPELRQPSLAAGIAQEMQWLAGQFALADRA